MENIGVKKLKKAGKGAAYYAVMFAEMLWIFIPFCVILVTSVVSFIELASTMEFVWWPKEGMDFSAYKTVLADDIYATTELPTLVLGFFNTLWIAVVSVAFKLFFSGLAAYGYAKLHFKGKEVFFMLQLATMMIPTACMTMTSYIWYYLLGWTDTFLPVIVPGLFGSATIIFFLRGYFEGIPTEVLEAAKIDGMGTFRSYLQIMIPLSVPAFMAQLIFCFVGSYNNYTGPLLYLTKPEQVTLQLALTKIQTAYGNYNNVRCAAAVVGLLPMILIYCVCQKFFLEGLTVGGSKE